MSADLNPAQDKSPWQRTVTTRTYSAYHGAHATSQHTEYLDMDAAVKRLHEVMRERPDASKRDWLDVALNGWPDD